MSRKRTRGAKRITLASRRSGPSATFNEERAAHGPAREARTDASATENSIGPFLPLIYLQTGAGELDVDAALKQTGSVSSGAPTPCCADRLRSSGTTRSRRPVSSGGPIPARSPGRPAPSQTTPRCGAAGRTTEDRPLLARTDRRPHRADPGAALVLESRINRGGRAPGRGGPTSLAGRRPASKNLVRPGRRRPRSGT